jgi:hypothetical protein
MNEKCWKQKTFTKCKNQQLFTKKDFFFFSNFLRFHAANIKEFRAICELLMLYMHCKNYEQKDFFLAIDKETQSSNKEENENIFFFFFILFTCKSRNKGKIPTNLKPRKNEILV